MRTSRQRRNQQQKAEEDWNQYLSVGQQNINQIQQQQLDKPEPINESQNMNVIQIQEPDDAFFDNLPLQIQNIPPSNSTEQRNSSFGQSTISGIPAPQKVNGLGIPNIYSSSNFQEIEQGGKLSFDNSSDNSAIAYVPLQNNDNSIQINSNQQQPVNTQDVGKNNMPVITQVPVQPEPPANKVIPEIAMVPIQTQQLPMQTQINQPDIQNTQISQPSLQPPTLSIISGQVSAPIFHPQHPIPHILQPQTQVDGTQTLTTTSNVHTPTSVYIPSVVPPQQIQQQIGIPVDQSTQNIQGNQNLQRQRRRRTSTQPEQQVIDFPGIKSIEYSQSDVKASDFDSVMEMTPAPFTSSVIPNQNNTNNLLNQVQNIPFNSQQIQQSTHNQLQLQQTPQLPETTKVLFKSLFQLLPLQIQPIQRIKDAILHICMQFSQNNLDFQEKNAFWLLCYLKAQLAGEAFGASEVVTATKIEVQKTFFNIQNAIKTAEQNNQFDLALLLMSLNENIFAEFKNLMEILLKIMQKYDIYQYKDIFFLEFYELDTKNIKFDLQIAVSIMGLNNVQKFIKYMFLCLNNPQNDPEIIKILTIIFFNDESIINYNIYVYFYAKLVTEFGCKELNNQELQLLMEKNNTLNMQNLNILQDSTINLLLMELLEYTQMIKICEYRQQETVQLFSYLKLQNLAFSPLLLIQKINTYVLIDNPYILQSQKFEYINVLMQYMKTIVQRIPENKQIKKYAYLQNAMQIQTSEVQKCSNIHEKTDLIYLIFQKQNPYKLNVQIQLNGQGLDLLNVQVINIFDQTTRQIFTEFGKLMYQVAQRYNLSFQESEMFNDELISIGNLFNQTNKQAAGQQFGVSAQQAKKVISKLADNLAKIIFRK